MTDCVQLRIVRELLRCPAAPLRLAMGVLVLLLASCQAPPAPTRGETATLRSKPTDDLVQEARLSSSPRKDNLLTQAAVQLAADADNRLTNEVLSLLFDVNARELIDQNFPLYTKMYARWLLDQKQASQASELLLGERLEHQLTDLDPVIAIPLYELRLELFAMTHNNMRAVEDRLALSALLMKNEAQEKNTAQIWELLQQLTDDEQQQLTQQHASPQLAAWLELAHIANSLDLDLESQVTLLDHWLEQHPHHPATLHLPPELAQLQDAIKHRPQHITLILPLSGNLQKAGEAVRDGFLAAYYQAMTRNNQVPVVQVIDSPPLEHFMEAYQAAAANSDLVIGPLEKEKVALLRAKGSLSCPTLVLNDLGSDTSQATSNLYQFGLNPEDEIRQIISDATQHRYHRALAIVPASDWGQRVSASFLEAWPATDPAAAADSEPRQLLGTVQFDPAKQDYASVLEKALGIEDSKQRERLVRQWIPEKTEFEARPRQDVDMILLAARPEQARQIKPLLSFYSAGDIPVYATSTIYSGQADPEKDQDLNGVQFLISPWMFAGSELHDDINTQLQPGSAMQSLYALGADAWRLHARLNLLAANPRGQLYGYTGVLRLDHNRHVYRTQLWATVNKGKVTMQPTALP